MFFYFAGCTNFFYMSKKQGFLKQNPIVPSLFFILFAWGLLYLITGVKGANKSLPAQAPLTVFQFQDEEKGWKLDLTEQKIEFTPNAKSKAIVYEFPKIQFIDAKENHTLKIFTAQDDKSQLQVSLTHFKSNLYQVIIQHNKQFYYYYGK